MITQIRAVHRHVYRSGNWAVIIGVDMVQIGDAPSHPCYFVRFPDGETDLWPIYDPDHRYEFREASLIPGDGIIHVERGIQIGNGKIVTMLEAGISYSVSSENMRERVVTTFQDGSVLTGPWLPVKDPIWP